MQRPRLDIRHLSMMDAIARLGSVSEAARSLGMTQPAISRRLQEAERRLGVELFHREGKSMRLTIAGDTIVQCARRTLGDLAHSERSAAQIPEDPFVPLRISLGHYDDYGWFPAFFKHVERTHPQVSLGIVNAGEMDLTQALDGNLIDLAVMAGPIDRRHFAATPLFEDELVAVSHPTHAFTEKGYLEAEDFSDSIYATYGVSYHKGFESDRVLLPADVWPHRVVSIGSNHAILDFVEAGAGITVLSAWAARKRKDQGRVATSKITAEGLPIAWNAVVRRADGPQAIASKVAKTLKRWCAGKRAALATPP